MILSGWICQPSILHRLYMKTFKPLSYQPNKLNCGDQTGWCGSGSLPLTCFSVPAVSDDLHCILHCCVCKGVAFFLASFPLPPFVSLVVIILACPSAWPLCISCSLKRVCIKCPNSLTAVTEIRILANQKHTFGFAGSFLEDSRVLVEVCKRTGIAYITFLGFAYFNAVRKMQMKRVRERGIPIEACLFLVWSRNGL